MFVIALVLTLITFAIIDSVWLATMTGRIYRPMMGTLLTERFNMVAAVAFYGLYAFGLTWFLVYPAATGQLPSYGLPPFVALSVSAAFLGLFAYGTYNLTALAVIRDWSLRLTVIDMAWGAVVTTLGTHIAVALTRLFMR